ncbi:MAG: hypothetical protein HY875_12805 [Chloroflexi bacterium]|nr:hypothetical protein [Chloroflexota bacterium]
MIELDMARARERELTAQARTIDFRLEWDRISTVERLERALKTAKRRVFASSNTPAHA